MFFLLLQPSVGRFSVECNKTVTLLLAIRCPHHSVNEGIQTTWRFIEWHWTSPSYHYIGEVIVRQSLHRYIPRDLLALN